MNRIDALRKSAHKENKPNAFLIFNTFNLTYFTGFSGATAMLIPENGESTLYVSPVNYEQAKAETSDLNVTLLRRGENLMDKIASNINASKTKKLNIDTLNIDGWRALAKSVGGEEKLEVSNGLIRELRKVKDTQEIRLIRKACDLASEGMRVAYETVKPGVKEKEVAAEIEYAMRKKGSCGTGFDTIVASGVNSAFSHGGCTEKTIQQGDLVVVDLGATFKFYRSDMTRTFVAGKASEKQRKIYQTVKIAHKKAFETLKPNVSASEVDIAARQAIEKAGYGDFFVHNLGHGVGLEVHEPPILSPDSKDVLAAGNVVTDEPGIYLVGYGGVRIEDTVLIGKNGAKKLTVGPYILEASR